MKISIDLISKNEFMNGNVILTCCEDFSMIIENKELFLNTLEDEYDSVNLKKEFYNMEFNIRLNDEVIGLVEVCTCNIVNDEECFYELWHEYGYSTSIIAKNIINENLFYKMKNFNRIAVITYFILYDTNNRKKGMGDFAFKTIENILKKIFKIDILYLYSFPLELSDNAKLYNRFMESSDFEEVFLFDELSDLEKQIAIDEYEYFSKLLDGFYYKNNMEYINNHVFMKILR